MEKFEWKLKEGNFLGLNPRYGDGNGAIRVEKGKHLTFRKTYQFSEHEWIVLCGYLQMSSGSQNI